MKNIYLSLVFIMSAICADGQFFQATIEKNGNDLIFLLRANPSGGDITTNWSDTEFFVRWPDGTPAFNFGVITINSADFPGVSIPNNGTNAQGSETGFTNNWFGTSFSTTATQTYLDGTEYEIFRVTLDVAAETIDFELVHNNFFAPHYLALIDGNGSDLSNVAGNMFYGNNAEICSPNCPASTPGSNHVDEGNLGPLPVELISFRAELQSDLTVSLNWQTASERNNLGFEIERSHNGQDWKVIGFVNGEGTTSGPVNYHFQDEFPLDGINYYRLKQVDFDRAFEYSEVEVVEMRQGVPEIAVYPNPTTGELNIKLSDSFNSSQSASVQIQLFNSLGASVSSFELSGNELSRPLSLTNYPKGVYSLLLTIDQKVYTKQIIVH